MKWIDFHCHVDLYDDPQAILASCARSGVAVFAVSTIPAAADRLKPLVSASGAVVHIGVGLHPEVAHEHQKSLELLLNEVRTHRFVGEVGLDGSPQYREHQATQRRILEGVLSTCEREGGKILSVHSRRAVRSVLDMLAQHPDAGMPVLHWFSGSPHELAEAVMSGCWFSVGLGMLQTASGREIVASMPRNRVLTETDGPFAQAAGKSLTPLDIERTVGVLAKVWSVPPESARATVWSNYEALVG